MSIPCVIDFGVFENIPNLSVGFVYFVVNVRRLSRHLVFDFCDVLCRLNNGRRGSHRHRRFRRFRLSRISPLPNDVLEIGLLLRRVQCHHFVVVVLTHLGDFLRGNSAVLCLGLIVSDTECNDCTDSGTCSQTEPQICERNPVHTPNHSFSGQGLFADDMHTVGHAVGSDLCDLCGVGHQYVSSSLS